MDFAELYAIMIVPNGVVSHFAASYPTHLDNPKFSFKLQILKAGQSQDLLGMV